MSKCVALCLLLALLAGAGPAAAGEDGSRIEVPDDPLLEEYPTPAYVRLLDLADLERPLTPEEEAEARRLLSEVKEHLARWKKEPDYRREWMLDRVLAVHPLFRGFERKIVVRAPYFVVTLLGPDADTAPEPAPDGFLDTLAGLHRFFRDTFGGRFDLPELEELRVAWFPRAEDFMARMKGRATALPAGVRAFYSPADTWLVARAPFSGWNEWKVRHEATHQLVHAFSKRMMERDTGGEVLWSDPRLHSRNHWFQEGFAELLAAAGPGEDGAWRIGPASENRKSEIMATRHAKRSEWSLAELLSFANSLEMRRAAMEKGVGEAGRLASLFYAEAGFFCHFLWEEHRDLFVDYFGSELHGHSGHDVWEEAMKKAGVDEEELDAQWKPWLAERLK